jgi:hypothetical protein
MYVAYQHAHWSGFDVRHSWKKRVKRVDCGMMCLQALVEGSRWTNIRDKLKNVGKQVVQQALPHLIPKILPG